VPLRLEAESGRKKTRERLNAEGHGDAEKSRADKGTKFENGKWKAHKRERKAEMACGYQEDSRLQGSYKE
jgi:hypothetical protein